MRIFMEICIVHCLLFKIYFFEWIKPIIMSNENLFAIFPYNFSCNMSTKTILLPPKTVKGMLLLNKEDFKREITVPILKILQPIDH